MWNGHPSRTNHTFSIAEYIVCYVFRVISLNDADVNNGGPKRNSGVIVDVVVECYQHHKVVTRTCVCVGGGVLLYI